jgi:hypothetical protein
MGVLMLVRLYGHFVIFLFESSFSRSDIMCPESRDDIEIYYQTLLPAYRFSLQVQKTSSTIADVIPSLVTIISQLRKLKLQGEPSRFRYLLIGYLRMKFKNELNSNIYPLASLLDIGKTHLWARKASNYEYVNKGLDGLIAAVMELAKIPNQSKSKKKNYYGSFFDYDFEDIDDNVYLAEQTLKNEKEAFVDILKESSSLEEQTSKKFWYSNKTKFPNLSKVAMRLLNIPSSSAFIERYFSLCGAVTTKRNGNMSTRVFIQRCLLKANFKVLEDLKHV